MILWIYPTHHEVNLLNTCAANHVTPYWTDWYLQRRDSAAYMRSLALSYSE